jgi:hypothetical protein
VSNQPTFTLTSATPPTHKFASSPSLFRRRFSSAIKGESIMIHHRHFRYALHADADTSTVCLFSDSFVAPKHTPIAPEERYSPHSSRQHREAQRKETSRQRKEKAVYALEYPQGHKDGAEKARGREGQKEATECKTGHGEAEQGHWGAFQAVVVERESVFEVGDSLSSCFRRISGV